MQNREKIFYKCEAYLQLQIDLACVTYTAIP